MKIEVKPFVLKEILEILKGIPLDDFSDFPEDLEEFIKLGDNEIEKYMEKDLEKILEPEDDCYKYCKNCMKKIHEDDECNCNLETY